MAKVRIGFVGVGNMGQCAHLVNYVDREDCQVVALAELRPGLAQAVAQRYGVPKVYPDWRQMLAGEQLDGIVAVQHYSLHRGLIPSLLAAGKPVLTEKPLAESVASGRAILEAAQRAGAPLHIAYHKRSDPASLYARQLIASLRAGGELGKLRYIRVAMPPGDWVAAGFSHLLRSDEKFTTEWAAQPDKRYDIFVNYYIHQVNLLRFLLGEDYAVTFADPGGVLLAGRSASGVTVSLEMAAYQTSLDWQEEALVAFERGWIKLELPAPLTVNRPGRVAVFRDPGQGVVPTLTQPSLPWVHAMRQQASHFLQAVQGQDTVLCSAADALKDLEVAHRYMELLRESEALHGIKQGA